MPSLYERPVGNKTISFYDIIIMFKLIVSEMFEINYQMFTYMDCTDASLLAADEALSSDPIVIEVLLDDRDTKQNVQ